MIVATEACCIPIAAVLGRIPAMDSTMGYNLQGMLDWVLNFSFSAVPGRIDSALCCDDIFDALPTSVHAKDSAADVHQ